MVWEANWSMQEELTEEQQKGWKNRVAAKRFAANKDNDYLIDRERQKKVNFSGMENVTPIQDAAMQESMGAIIQMRKHLIQTSKALERHQTLPPGVKNPEAYFAHGEQLLLSKNQNWLEAYTNLMKELYAHKR